MENTAINFFYTLKYLQPLCLSVGQVDNSISGWLIHFIPLSSQHWNQLHWPSLCKQTNYLTPVSSALTVNLHSKDWGQSWTRWTNVLQTLCLIFISIRKENMSSSLLWSPAHFSSPLKISKVIWMTVLMFRCKIQHSCLAFVKSVISSAVHYLATAEWLRHDVIGTVKCR